MHWLIHIKRSTSGYSVHVPSHHKDCQIAQLRKLINNLTRNVNSSLSLSIRERRQRIGSADASHFPALSEATAMSMPRVLSAYALHHGQGTRRSRPAHRTDFAGKLLEWLQLADVSTEVNSVHRVPHNSHAVANTGGS
jgi:hypothetical protein